MFIVPRECSNDLWWNVPEKNYGWHEISAYFPGDLGVLVCMLSLNEWVVWLIIPQKSGTLRVLTPH
jgi:hypothetical protein